MIKVISFVLFIAIFVIACKGSKKTTKEVVTTTVTEEPVVTNQAIETNIESLGVKRSPCYGRCPTYDFTVQADGSFLYHGKMHVDNMGKWTGQLSEEATRELWAHAGSLELGQYKRKYKSNIMDIPKSTLMVGRPDSLQMITGDVNLPKPVVALMAQLDTLSQEFPMELVEANVPRNAIPGEVIVNLAGDNSPEMVIRSMTDYTLSLKNKVSPALSLYVLTFDPLTTNAGKLLVDLKNNDMVVEAQFNQSADQRNK